MNRAVALFTAAALSVGAFTTAHAYSATAAVTFTWSSGGTSIGWTSNGANNFPDPTIAGNNTQVFLAGGNNSTTYYNPDFAIASDYGAGTGDDCLTKLPGFETIDLRKYSCRQKDTPGDYGYQGPNYRAAPITDIGPGAAASGMLTVTDTTLTGTLTVISTTDEPAGGTTVFFTPPGGIGVNIGISSGNGSNGYNIRTADGSPFGNAWYGITTAGALNVNLSGTFTNSSWTIDGGTVTFTDAGFACQQGGLGGDARGTLCTPSGTGGGFQPNGAQLSWGIDKDGVGTGELLASPIQIRDPIPSPPATQQVLATLSGVLAHLTLDVSGNIATTDGEFRYGLGNAGGGCLDYLIWGPRPSPETGNGLICGTLSTGPLVVTGIATEDGGGTDTVPDPFTFVNQDPVPLNTLVTSDPVTITGIDAPAPVMLSSSGLGSVLDSQYSINGGAFTSAAGVVRVNDQVRVRHTSCQSAGCINPTTLDIGGVTSTFTSTTEPSDVTPDPFTLTNVTDVPLGTVQSSAITPAAVAGINDLAVISVSGDPTSRYSINGGPPVSADGLVSAGDTVVVSHTSSGAFSSVVSTTLNIGGVIGVNATFTSTTAAQDTTPDPFTLTNVTNVPRATLQSSATTPATVAGINSPAPISVSGDATSEYSTGGAFTNVAGTVSAGQTVVVRHTSSGAFSGVVSTVLNIGGVTRTFTSTTLAEDTTPDPFTLTDVTGVPRATLQSSAITPATVAGINSPAPISVSGDATSQYSIDGGAFTNVAGTVSAGQTVVVSHTSSGAFSGVVSTTLNIGGVTRTFTSTTLAEDTTPDAFSFTDEPDVALSTPITSNTITVSGINSPATLVLSGDASSTCSVNGGACAATVSNGDTVAVQHTSAATEGTDVTTTLTIGGIADEFKSTTETSSINLREDDGGSSLDALILALLGFTALIRRRR